MARRVNEGLLGGAHNRHSIKGATMRELGNRHHRRLINHWIRDGRGSSDPGYRHPRHR